MERVGRAMHSRVSHNLIMFSFSHITFVLLFRKDYIQREFDDYTADSQQLEKEYEATIEQHEKTIKELRSVNNKLQNEVESLRLKLEQANKENEALQSDVAKMNSEKVQMSRYIRELEQKNDDLERSERAIGESIQAIEAALNMAIERNAMLESEIDEKESLKEKLQRLADETRGGCLWEIDSNSVLFLLIMGVLLSNRFYRVELSRWRKVFDVL